MVKRRKGRVPPHLRKFLFKKGRSKRRGRSSASMAKHKKRRGRSSGGSRLNIMDPVLGFGYGYIRSKAATAASPLIGKIPGGAYADNLLLGGGVYLASYFFKPKGMIKQAAETIVICEAFNAGQKASMGVSLTATAQTAASGGFL